MEKIGLEATAQFADVALVMGHQIEKGTVTLSTGVKSAITAYFEHTHENAPFYFVVWREDSNFLDESVTQFVFRYGQTGAGADPGVISLTKLNKTSGATESASLVLDGTTSSKKPGQYATNEHIHAVTMSLIGSARFQNGTYNWIAAFDE